MNTKKEAPNNQGAMKTQLNSNQYAPKSQAEFERLLAPTQWQALTLTRSPSGTNDIEALEIHGLSNFIQRKWELENLGFMFLWTLETYTDIQGTPHERVRRFRFQEGCYHMVGCKDKEWVDIAILNRAQMDLFCE